MQTTQETVSRTPASRLILALLAAGLLPGPSRAEMPRSPGAIFDGSGPAALPELESLEVPAPTAVRPVAEPAAQAQPSRPEWIIQVENATDSAVTVDLFIKGEGQNDDQSKAARLQLKAKEIKRISGPPGMDLSTAQLIVRHPERFEHKLLVDSDHKTLRVLIQAKSRTTTSR